jgi:hypothetical protein
MINVAAITKYEKKNVKKRSTCCFWILLRVPVGSQNPIRCVVHTWWPSCVLLHASLPPATLSLAPTVDTHLLQSNYAKYLFLSNIFQFSYFQTQSTGCQKWNINKVKHNEDNTYPYFNQNAGNIFGYKTWTSYRLSSLDRKLSHSSRLSLYIKRSDFSYPAKRIQQPRKQTAYTVRYRSESHVFPTKKYC